MKWNLELIYPTVEAWEQDFQLLDGYIKDIEELKGKLGTKEGFKAYMDLDRIINGVLSRVYVYASMNNDQNQKDVETSKRIARIQSKANQVYQAASFINPELLTLDKDVLLSYCTDGYEGYKVQILDLFRNNEHVLDDKGERIVSNFSEALSGYRNLYSELTIKDNEEQPVTLSDGTEIKVSLANMTYYLGKCEKQEDRKKVFEAVYKFYDAHKNTLSQIYKGVMDSEKAMADTRGYSSILESHLYGKAIDPKVYTSLIETARATTAPVKRYIKLRKDYFKLEEYHTYDRFLTFRESKKTYDYKESKEMVLEALKFMGEDFYKKAEFCLADGRVDVYPQDGKRSGAYSTGVYDKGAFILLNHTGDLNSAFTLAHECGHSIHTTYSNMTQPIEIADYTIFVAEVASTFNEARFLDYLMENIEDKDEKIVVLQQAIDGLIATFYRQTLFADYEYQAHLLVEQDIPVDEAQLSGIMTKLYMEYYGIDLTKEDYKKLVWAYIPHHFYTPYYVYQYATSFSASQALYQDVKSGKEGAFDRYIGLLKAGGSKYPVEELKDAGVDLTTSAPFKAVADRLSELVDELEALLQE